MPTSPDDESDGVVSDQYLASLMGQCVHRALEALLKVVEEGVKPQRVSPFVRIVADVDGQRTKFTDNAPFDYGSLLKGHQSGSWEKGVTLSELQGFEDLENYLRDTPEYWKSLSSEVHLQHPEYPEWPEAWFNSKLRTLIARIVDRHIHTSGWDFNAQAFLRAYALIEPTLRVEFVDSPQLTVDVMVPLVGVKFDAESPTGIARIERLEPAQLAACWPGHQIGQEDESLLLRATHAWVQPDVPIKFQPLAGWPVPHDLDFEPLERLLEITAASVNQPFGVKHVLYRPRGWAEAWVGGGLPAGGTWTWTYERLANGLDGLDSPPEPIRMVLSETQRRLSALSAGRHELQLAARRLLLATCRTDPSDTVVDSCIGIEALLGDSSPTEITYKLALRSAALLSAVDLADASVVFPAVKRLYHHRSKIVHGKLKPVDDNTIDAFGGKFSAHSVATVLLGLLLQAMLDNPDLADRTANDDLILSRLDRRNGPPLSDDGLQESAQ